MGTDLEVRRRFTRFCDPSFGDGSNGGQVMRRQRDLLHVEGFGRVIRS